MNFPNTITPNLDTRAGRMLAAGRVKVTVTSHKTGEHITILFKVFVDNRNKEFAPKGKNWMPCTWDEATHVFIEVPNQGDWNDKVGTYYPRNGKFYEDRSADGARIYAAALAARWLNGETFESTCQEESECARCGLTLTDPVSIARGIGPVCLGKMTGSQHQVKVREAVEGTIPQEILDLPEDTDLSLDDEASALARATGSTKVTVTHERRNEDGTLDTIDTGVSEPTQDAKDDEMLARAQEIVMSLSHAAIHVLRDYCDAVINQDADDRPHLVNGDNDFLGR